MKQTIYYLSDVKWKRETFKAHVKYAESSKDFRAVFGNKEEVIKAASMAMSKRKNALAGFSCVFAIPNALDDDGVSNLASKVKSIFSNIIGTDYILIYYHDSTSIANNKNKHFHIIVSNLNKQGKSLRVNKKILKQLHSELQSCLRNFGYEIKKDEEGMKIPHLGYRMLKDQQVIQEYIQYLQLKKQKQNEVKEVIEAYERELAGLEDEIRRDKAADKRLRADTTAEAERTFTAGREISKDAHRLQQKLRELRIRVHSSSSEVEQLKAKYIADRGAITTEANSPIPAAARLQPIAFRIQQASRKNQHSTRLFEEVSRAFAHVLRSYSKSFERLRTTYSEPYQDVNLIYEYYDKLHKVNKHIREAKLILDRINFSLKLDRKITEAMLNRISAINKQSSDTTELKKSGTREQVSITLQGLIELYSKMKAKNCNAFDFLYECTSMFESLDIEELIKAIEIVDKIDYKNAEKVVDEFFKNLIDNNFKFDNLHKHKYHNESINGPDYR